MNLTLLDYIKKFAHFIKHDAFWLETISRTDIFQSIDDFLPTGVFLVAKLICWKRQNHQFVAVLLAEFIHLREVTDCCA